MEKLVSSWCNNQSLPESYIFSPEKRPGKVLFTKCNEVPVVDLSKALDHNRTDIVQQILKACQDFGFFQVINHGVFEKLINDTMSVAREFFEMPVEDRASLYSEDKKKGCRLSTGGYNYPNEEAHYWRDSLNHHCHPLEECIKSWPEKPTRYREVISTYSVEANKLGQRILELISEGLGLETDYFGANSKLSENQSFVINHYPPCPDPSLTFGLPKHCDPNLITILLQGDVQGLQVFKDGEWIGVEPLPNAFVINVGYQLQIISNNKLKSAEHRALTNTKVARTSAGYFISPHIDCIVKPAKSLTNASNPPLYKAFQYSDFLVNFLSEASPRLPLEPFKLQA